MNKDVKDGVFIDPVTGEEHQIKLIHKHGFPASTPWEDAQPVAIAKALEIAGGGDVLAVERVQTPEHEAAGEYLVKVVVG